MSVYVGFKTGKMTKHQAYISEYYCGGCGYPVSDHDSYCSECGGAFRKEDATEHTCKNTSLKSDQFICSNCQAHYDIARLDIDVEDDTGIPNFCPNCGAKVVVVRCKECKYWKVNSMEYGLDCHTEPDCFCAWGEHKVVE